MNKLSNNPRNYGEVWAINVDMQNDFVRPDGALSVEGGEEIIDPLNEYSEWVRSHGGIVVHTADWHPKDTAHFKAYGGNWPVHCVENTEGAQLHRELIVKPQDTFAIKGTSKFDDGYSPLEAVPQSGWLAEGSSDVRSGYTIRDAILEAEERNRKHGMKLAIGMGGIATDWCLRAGVMDALAATDRSVTDIYLLQNAARAVEPDAGDRAIAAMVEAGAIAISTQDAIRGGITVDVSRLER